MKHITRDIDPVDAHDLLERVPRASLAFAGEQGPCAQPIDLAWRAGRYFVGLATTANPTPTADQEVVLLVDDGAQFFDLRAIYIRGTVKPIDPPVNVPTDRIWFEVLPLKTVAWDYGTLREVHDARLRSGRG